jgi:lysyl endopeptidase
MKLLPFYSAVFLAFISVPAISQIQTGELPSSFCESEEKSSNLDYSTFILDPELTALKTEDAITDEHKDIAWRFGTAMPVNYTLDNSGIWTHNDTNRTSVWKFRIAFKDAVTINLNFNAFKLSTNAKLFAYNSDYSDILGAITAANNKEDGQFSIRPIKGNSITLELVVPQNELEMNQVAIEHVIYGYRSIHDKVQKVFQSSGNCNINVNCPEGDNWQDVKRSVALVTTATNTRFCTATLINNVRQDSTPYILGAAHCGLRGNSIFIFGYESASCNPNANGILTNSISGSGRKAITVNFGSDFELRELSSTPPSSYNVYYSGWNNENVTSAKSVCIHHPAGDVKKISIDEDFTASSGYYSSGVTHWQVSNWEQGTTEGGSSGAPLFDANQRIIGQLHGGYASCTNRAQDYFGKFSRSWDFSSDTSRQLKRWLDPDNTGTFVLDGMDPNPAPFNVDLNLLDIDGLPEFECTQNVQASFKIKNLGNFSVDSFYVDYQLNGGLVQSLLYNSQLTRQGIASFNRVSLTPQNGRNVLFVTIRTVGAVDQNLGNNSDSAIFTVNTSNADQIYVTLKTDDYGSETSWLLEDENNSTVLHSSPSYPNINGGNTYFDSLCIYNSCFRFSIFDSQGDGFNDPSGNFGNGYLLVTKNQSDTLFFENNFRNSLSTDTFCVQFTTSVNEISRTGNSLIAYPNPVKAGENIKLSSHSLLFLTLRNLNGQIITSTIGNELYVPTDIAQGVYFLEVRSRDNDTVQSIKKVLVQ